MKKLIGLRNYILFGGIALTFAMLGTFLIFGNSADKLSLSILTVVLPFIFYGFIRLAFLIVSKNASEKIMTVFSYFFIIGCTLGFVLSIIPYFIMQFPNGYSPTIAAVFAIIIGVLDYNSK